METDTFKTIAEVLTTGSNAALVFALWIAWKAAQSAKQAVTHIKEIRDVALKVEPQLKEIARDVTEIKRDADELKEGIASLLKHSPA